MCYSDPRWLGKLRLASGLKLGSILVLLLMGVAASRGVLAAAAVFEAGWIITQGLSLWAAFLITVPEPGALAREGPITLRKVVRLCALAGVTGYVLCHAGTLAPWGPAIVLAAGGAVWGLAKAAQLYCELVYYRRLARRVPDRQLEESTTIVFWGFLISYALLALVWVLNGIGTAAGAMACAGLVGIVAFALFYIILLFHYGAAFKQAAARARQRVSPSPPDA